MILYLYKIHRDITMNTDQLSVANNMRQQLDALNNPNPVSREVIRITVLNPDLSYLNTNLTKDVFVSAGDITYDALKGLMIDAVNELAQSYTKRGAFSVSDISYEWDADQDLPDASTLINPFAFTHIIDKLAGKTDIKASFKWLKFPLVTTQGNRIEFFIDLAWSTSTAPQTFSKYHRYY